MFRLRFRRGTSRDDWHARGMQTRTVGLVLAAGAGTRMGRPKALVRDDTGRPWVETAVGTLLDGGCDGVVVVLGAAADEARAFVPVHQDVRAVVAGSWADGLGASLDAGLAALAEDPTVDAALVSLVDLPGLPADAVRRVIGPAGSRADALRQAVHDGRPGHPVLLGRAHWAALRAELDGDRGAGVYLRRNAADRVECADLWDGADQDRPTP